MKISKLLLGVFLLLPLTSCASLSGGGNQNNKSTVAFKQKVEAIDTNIDFINRFFLEEYVEEKDNTNGKVNNPIVTNPDIIINKGEDRYPFYNTIELVQDFNNMFNLKMKTYADFIIDVLNNWGSNKAVIKQAQFNGETTDYIMVEKQETNRLKNLYSNPIVTSSSNRTCFAISEHGIDIYRKHYGVEIIQSIRDDLMDSVMDEYYSILWGTNGDITKVTYCSYVLNSNQPTKVYYSLYRDGNDVYCVQYDYFFNEGYMLKNALTTTLYRHGVAISSFFEERPGGYYPDSLLKNNERVFWVMIINDPKRGNVYIHPFANCMSVSASLMENWRSFVFSGDFYANDNVVGFNGYLAKQLVTNIRTINYSINNDTGANYNEFYPVTSTVYSTGKSNNPYVPARLTFVGYYDNPDIDVISFIDNLAGNIDIALDIGIHVRDQLSMIRFDQMYDTNMLFNYVPSDCLRKWINIGLSEIMNPRNAFSSYMRNII